MKNKKAQIEQLQGLIVALVVIAIILVVGFLIFAQTKEQVVSLISTSTATNESYSYTNNTLAALTHSPTALTGTVACTAVYNDTANAVTIGSGNYTCNNAGLTVTDSVPNNVSWGFASTLYVTYTYKAPDYAYNASSDVQNATQDIPGWLPIIVVVVIGALLIGLVSFLRRQTG
uniref:Uncharacterized protein n=1 Tax=viral metagenome TaxID=1070528 RepID=A0A6H1ZJC1_9ZZZZ